MIPKEASPNNLLADRGWVASQTGGKADKAPNPTAGNLAALDAQGNPVDSGKKPSDFQAKLTFDTTPTAGSQNPVTSEGIRSAIDTAAATNTANFLGTYSYVTDLGFTQPSSAADVDNAAIAVALGGLAFAQTPTNNDYVFVSINYTPTTDVDEFRRFKFNGTLGTWAYEYTLNNSSFTAEQWAAISSGITSGLVAKLGALPTAEALAQALAGKANRAANPTAGNLAALDAQGNPTDSGKSFEDIQDQIDTESPLLARSYAIPQQSGWTVNQGSSSSPIYFRPRYFGMKDGDLFKGIVLRTRSTDRTPFPSGVYMRVKRYSDGQTLGVSELTVWPDTASTDVVFRFSRAVELTSSGNYYMLEFSETPTGSAVNFGMTLYSLPSSASSPDFYFALSTNVPIATVQFYSWEELTGADIPVSGTDPTKIDAALAGKANDNAVVHLTGEQQTVSAVLQLMYTLYAEEGVESHGDYRQTWRVGNDFAGELIISEGSISVRLADEYDPRWYKLQAGGGGTVALLENIAPAFVYFQSYGVDELCTSFDADPNHKGYWLYKCIVATDGSTPPEIDPTHWVPATVEDVLAALRTALAGKLNNTTDTMSGDLTVRGSLTVGSRRDDSTIGVKSTAEGKNTTASGTYSHAEGEANTASGPCSHAEGSSNTASGYYSHAEGIANRVGGTGSHAEGGNTVASGSYSHAEGSNTTAGGHYSHAEGNSTTAQNDYEHAQGRYNASHKANTTWGSAGNTLSSIGFGSGNNARTNAVETMQDGKTFIYGLGGYNGTNPTGSGVQDLASVVNAKANAADLRYALTSKPVTNGTVALDDLASNWTTTNATTMELVFPDFVEGKSRDFVWILEATGSSAPGFSYGSFLTVLADAGTDLAPEKGINVYSFSEVAPAKFIASRRKVAVVVSHEPANANQLAEEMLRRGYSASDVADAASVAAALGLPADATFEDCVDKLMNG